MIAKHTLYVSSEALLCFSCPFLCEIQPESLLFCPVLAPKGVSKCTAVRPANSTDATFMRYDHYDAQGIDNTSEFAN